MTNFKSVLVHGEVSVSESENGLLLLVLSLTEVLPEEVEVPPLPFDADPLKDPLALALAIQPDPVHEPEISEVLVPDEEVAPPELLELLEEDEGTYIG